MDIPNLNNVAVLALIGSIAAFWQQLKAGLLKVFSIFVHNDEIPGGESAYFIKYLAERSKIVRYGNRKYIESYQQYIDIFDGYNEVVFSASNTMIFLYKGYIPIFLSSSGNKLNVKYLFGSFDLKKSLGESYRICYFETKKVKQQMKKDEYRFFQVVNVEGDDVKFAEEGSSVKATEGSYTTEHNAANDSGLFNFFSTLGSKNEFVGIEYKNIVKPDIKKQTNYYWCNEGKELLKQVRYWLDSDQWFTDRKIAWRRGALLYGKPGTGKSKMVIEIAKELDLIVYNFNISNMSNSEFVKKYKLHNRGCIILIEDIDVVFQGRKNVLAEKSLSKNLLSFDALINTIDGIKNGDGAFTVITTNKMESLDSALIRPGRLDVKIEVKSLDIDGRKFVASNILRDWPDVRDKMVEDCEGMTAAEFENCCVEKAIELFYRDKI